MAGWFVLSLLSLTAHPVLADANQNMVWLCRSTATELGELEVIVTRTGEKKLGALDLEVRIPSDSHQVAQSMAFVHRPTVKVENFRIFLSGQDGAAEVRVTIDQSTDFPQSTGSQLAGLLEYRRDRYGNRGAPNAGTQLVSALSCTRN